MHSSLGTGFRAPALAELFFPFGNAALQPERSRGWDVGVNWQWLDGAIVMDATYFRTDFKNLIDFDFVTNTSPGNLDKRHHIPAF